MTSVHRVSGIPVEIVLTWQDNVLRECESYKKNFFNMSVNILKLQQLLTWYIYTRHIWN